MTSDEMERIAGDHATTAAKVRALNEAGVSTSDLSAFLGIRYQHAYNVLLRAGRIRRAEPAAVDQPIVALKVREDGSVWLPEELQAALNVAAGDQLFGRQVDDGLLLMPRDVAVAELQREAATRMPGHASLLSALLGTDRSGSTATPDG